MKYFNFNIFRFLTPQKSIKRTQRSFSRIYKKIKLILSDVANFFIITIKYILSIIFKSLKFIKNYYARIYKKISFRIYDIFGIFRNFSFKKFSYSSIYKYLNVKRYIHFSLYAYAFGFTFFSVIIYLSIPLFFSFNKSNLENIICKDLDVVCSIQGNVSYSFFPSPRIKFKNLKIQDFINKNKLLGEIGDVAIKVSFYNLHVKKKLNFTKIILKDAIINLDLENVNKYKKFFKKKFHSKPLNLKEGEINFFDGPKLVATIKDANFIYKHKNNTSESILKGGFINDEIYINLKNEKNDNNLTKFFVIKLPEFKLLAKGKLFSSESDKENFNGNILFKKNKNKIAGIFTYKDEKIIFKNVNLRNAFLDGKFSGEIEFLPFFNFNLNIDLDSVNFNRLLSSIISLSDENKKNLFKINKKINGKLNLSVMKIFSKHTLINSLESRIQFINGNILIDQLLLNLKKLGATDITGIIKNDKKFSNFKFENNIFIDNLKRFYNKFGIYTKEKTASNLFISGNFDLSNLKLYLSEISSKNKFTDENVTYIEKEFNDFILEDDYASLFDFARLKKFLKLITSEVN